MQGATTSAINFRARGLKPQSNAGGERSRTHGNDIDSKELEQEKKRGTAEDRGGRDVTWVTRMPRRRSTAAERRWRRAVRSCRTVLDPGQRGESSRPDEHRLITKISRKSASYGFGSESWRKLDGWEGTISSTKIHG